MRGSTVGLSTDEHDDRQPSSGGSTPDDAAAGGQEFRDIRERRRDILRWVYLARVGLAGGVFAAAALAWSVASPLQTLTASLLLVVTLVVTPISYWFTHVRREQPGSTFVYAQAIIDVLLVTIVVHLTGGSQSVVPPLYILVISAYTLMLPLRGGFLVAGLACMAYIADVVRGHGTDVDIVVALQLGIFVAVALVVGFIGTKLREAGAELTSVEHELEQLRLETTDILGNIPTAVLTVDGWGRLAYANPAAEKLLGIEAEPWLDRRFMDELSQRAPELHSVLDRTRRHRVPVASAEVEVVKEGQAIPVGVSTAVLERRDEEPSVTAIMRDISDRKRMEELRWQTERLEAVAELSASLAHEIKNPLASIRSSVQQLGLREAADEDDQLLARLILRESDRLSRLLSDFIDFARVRIVRSAEIDLREVVRNALEMVRQHPDYSDRIAIEETLDSEPVTVEADEDLIHRVVTNLVLNAVQAAGPSRRINVTVDVRNCRVDRTPQGLDVLSPVLLRVADDGPGIPEEDLGRIFDPFFSGRHGGTGLGLPIVHRAVQAHHGTVFVDSDPQSGTRFSIYLPGSVPARKPAWEA